MRRLAACFFFLALALPASAQSQMPERRPVPIVDTDLPGGDLRNIFDTTYEACEATCLTDTSCVAFTFNARSNACFPKGSLSTFEPYVGALSALIEETPSATLALAAERASDLEFLGENDLTVAGRYFRGLASRHPLTLQRLEDAEDRLLQARASDNPALIFQRIGERLALGGLTATQAREGALWVEYAQVAQAVRGDAVSNLRLRSAYVPAAVNAYLRADALADRGVALTVLAKALERVGRGRDSIGAWALAQELTPSLSTAAALERARATFGFRVVETQVDNEAASPRICAVFSETLSRGTDYSPFVSLPDERFAVTAQDSQLCVEGLSHGQRYRFVLRSGLPADSGEVLHKDIELVQYVRDRAPLVRFPGRAYFLPKTGGTALPIETVNTGVVALELRRVSDRNLLRAIQDRYFGRPLSAWQEERFQSEIAETVWTGEGVVEEVLNKEVTTRLPMDAALAGQPAGIYALQARVPGQDIYQTAAATQWFVLSDLGIASASGADGLHVMIRGLGDAQSRGSAEVQLISQSNAVLATGETDAQGYLRFAPGLALGQGGSAPALLVARDGDDMAFLSLVDPAFDLSDRGVEGRAPAGPVDVFLTTDRGAYRAGETVFATALARDGTALGIPDVPMTAVLSRPDGVEYTRLHSANGKAGGHVFALPLGGGVPRGTWTLEVMGDPKAAPWAQTQILVEDFLPERIDFDLALPEVLSPNARPLLDIAAEYLFGAPAAELPVEGEVTLRAATELEGFEGYRFGLYDSPFGPRTRSLADQVQTDGQGRAQVALDLPEGTADRPLAADVTIRIREGAARPVERRITRPLAQSGVLIGIKPDFEGAVPEGAEAGFDLVGVAADGTALPLPVKWTLNRVETRYQWYQLYGNWNYEPVTTRTRVANGTGTTDDKLSLPVDWGRYELVVEREGGAYAASSLRFDAGYYAVSSGSDTPDQLEVSLDKARYLPGETARLRVAPQGAGVAVVQVMSNRLIAMEMVELDGSETVIPLPVTEEWGAGAYVTATYIQPMDTPTGRNPARAMGLAYAAVDPGDKALTTTLEVASEAQPRQPLEVTVQTGQAGAAGQAWMTLAAVDVGILNLTAFQSPDPEAHYFGQRRLGMSLRDVYGRLIDGQNGALGLVRSGGDALAQMQLQSPPPTEDLVTFFSGPVAVDVQGNAQVSLDIPDFNGTLRLMAVAWTAQSVGSAEADVLIRDPIVVNASLPRFLAPGDQAELLIDITHVAGPTGSAQLDLGVDGIEVGAVPAQLTFAEGEQKRLAVPIEARDTGLAQITVTLTTPAGQVLQKALRLDIRRNDPPVGRTSRFTLADGGTFTFDEAAFDGFLAGSGRATMAFGPLARLDAPGLLSMLDRYPYGCTEQVTSQAMPLLYLSSVAGAMGLAGPSEIDQRIADAIDLVLSRQAGNGSFGLWSVGSGDLWLDAYVTDFLSRARQAGLDVPDRAFQSAMDNLRNRVNFAPEFDRGGEDLAYALMVLAREGAASMGDLRYYADVKGQAFATPLATAQLASALAAYGDPVRADRLFRTADAALARGGQGGQVWRSDYGSNLRDAAGLLALATETRSQSIDTAALTERIASTGRARSTQEAVWTLLATHALIDQPAGAGFEVNGSPVEGPLVQVLERAGESYAVQNLSGRDAQITVTTFGVPEVAPPADGNGYRISRRYFTTEGVETQLGDLRVGDRFVTVLQLRPLGARSGRLMVVDPLPAGVEIDNPNLLRSGDIRALPWLRPASVEQAEFRSDRFMAAVNQSGEDTLQLAYIGRVTQAGSFHHPAAHVEDMYRPQFRAQTDTSRVVLTR